LPEGQRERGSERPGARLQRPKGAEAAVVDSPPGPFELLTGRLPLLELPLPDLSPAFETAHFSLLLSARNYYHDHNI